MTSPDLSNLTLSNLTPADVASSTRSADIAPKLLYETAAEDRDKMKHLAQMIEITDLVLPVDEHSKERTFSVENVMPALERSLAMLADEDNQDQRTFLEQFVGETIISKIAANLALYESNPSAIRDMGGLILKGGNEALRQKWFALIINRDKK